MNIFRIILNFILKLFGIKKDEQEQIADTPVPDALPKNIEKTEQTAPSAEQSVILPKMKTDVFDVMTSEENEEVKDRLWSEMIENEKTGKFVYVLATEARTYLVRNGQFVSNPAGYVFEEAGETKDVIPKMTRAVFNVMTSSESNVEKAKLWNEMITMEQKGIFVYKLVTDQRVYNIQNGQFFTSVRT